MTDNKYSFKAFFLELYHHNPGLFRRSLALMLFAGLLEGLGLMLLVPLLAVLGVTSSDGKLPAYLSWIGQWTFNPGLGSILLLFVALVALQALLIRERDISTTRLRLQFIDHLRLEIFRAMNRASWNFFIQRKSAEFAHTIISDLGRIGLGTFSLLQLGIAVFLAFFYVLVAMQMSWAMTLLALGCGLLLWFILRKQNINAVQSGKALSRTSESLHHGLNEYLGNLKIAKSHNAEDRHLQIFTENLRDAQAQQLQFVRSRSATSVGYRLGAAVALCLLVYVAIRHFALGPDRLLVLTLIFARLMPMLANLQQQYQQILHMLPAFSSYQSLIRSIRQAREPETVSHENIGNFQHEIRFEHVSFAYQPGQDVLHDILCTLPAQKTIALVGASGSGKTTFVDLLTGLLAPHQGRITIDGITLTPGVRDAWHAQLAYVPQECILLNDTLRHNLLWLQPQATEAQIWEALDKASAKFVRDFPEGLDTLVGERGIRLSGGERQRIAMARALLRNPRLLILDEATSALDTQNERAIQETLDKLHGDLTIVMIAHRLSTVRNADIIFSLESRHLIQQGSWEELLQQNGVLESLRDIEKS